MEDRRNEEVLDEAKVESIHFVMALRRMSLERFD